jgi:MFS family permease
MSPPERRASASLALVFALRMLGLFLVLPVFAIEARQYTGGQDPVWVGMAMGAYGLTQAVMQMPLGLASDRLGRKRVIVAGLLLFALGSGVAAGADSVLGLAIGRGIQGAGAVSAAVSALLADLTRDQVRTKAMALIGASIGLTFAVSLVLAPWLTGLVGLSGLFVLTAVLAVLGIAVVLWGTPPTPVLAPHTDRPQGRLADVWLHPKLWRLDVGVFVLHAVQMAMWVAVPGLLVQAGLPAAQHWQVYLPAVLLSFTLMGGLFALERRGHLQRVLRAAVALLLVVQLAFAGLAGQGAPVWAIAAVLFLFFTSFNVLEASQPSLISRLAPPQARGAALGIYNTAQSLGLFAGGVLGGWLVKQLGPVGLFAATAGLVALWLLAAWHQPMPPQVTADGGAQGAAQTPAANA